MSAGDLTTRAWNLLGLEPVRRLKIEL